MRTYLPGDSASMRPARELLFLHGFLKDGHPLKSKSEDERKQALKAADGDERKALLSAVAQERIETADGYINTTPYPASGLHLRLVYESPNNSLETPYFWILEHMRQDRGFFDIIKITDVYAASEASAFWGNQQQRISAQQNQAQGFLANIGKFVKEIFQMVRELRIIDERLDAYEAWSHKEDDGSTSHSASADVTLKSLFTDQVEGGTKNPQSVFGLAQTVGFTILPDLFFNTRVYSTKDLEKKVETLDYNTSVKNVLRRKLYQFLVWRERTHKELLNRKEFNIRYLRQHWTIIKMYMSWVKPYLRNVQRLQMRSDLDNDPDMVSSFDQNITEVEFLAKRPKKGGYYPVVIVNFTFRTRPDMTIRREYQQGPAHMGRMDMNVRAYAWNDDEIAAYQKMKQHEEIELLGVLDKSLPEVMRALEDEFEKYVLDQEKTVPERDSEKEKKEKRERARANLKETAEPFVALVQGFGEVFGFLVPKMGGKKGKRKSGSRGGALGDAKANAFLTWHIYKKAQRFLTW